MHWSFSPSGWGAGQERGMGMATVMGKGLSKEHGNVSLTPAGGRSLSHGEEPQSLDSLGQISQLGEEPQTLDRQGRSHSQGEEPQAQEHVSPVSSPDSSLLSSAFSSRIFPSSFILSR